MTKNHKIKKELFNSYSKALDIGVYPDHTKEPIFIEISNELKAMLLQEISEKSKTKSNRLIKINNINFYIPYDTKSISSKLLGGSLSLELLNVELDNIEVHNLFSKILRMNYESEYGGNHSSYISPEDKLDEDLFNHISTLKLLI